MTRREVSLYGIVVTAVASMMSVVVSLLVAFTISNRAIDAEERNREASRIATCLVVRAQVEVYNESPPSTPTGQRARQAWRDLYARLRCDQG